MFGLDGIPVLHRGRHRSHAALRLPSHPGQSAVSKALDVKAVELAALA